MIVHEISMRPEGPVVDRPGRKAGIQLEKGRSAEGAAHDTMRSSGCRAFSAPFPTSNLIPALRPGLLTVGPSGLIDNMVTLAPRIYVAENTHGITPLRNRQ
jgi:hypothetical protein